ncbi:MAG: class I SAM-dependent rRNA methyltransferase [Labilithrix sp.]|nr:class I SAM-dependent rRNA methyltransferase [Labilithrix sp.]MBX3225003.1 class I SAM-dependent rRNA methyltransferase [Labilithrix sp.]
MATVRLKPGHVQPIWAGHPWVYAQAIERTDGATRGDEVKVLDPRGNFLGRGFYSAGSAIPVRLLVRDEKTPIDTSFFRARLERAVAARAMLGLGTGDETTGYRLVHAEGDLLPGLIVDRFGDVLAVQFLTFGMKEREAMVLEALGQVMSPRAIVDRTPSTSAKAEHFVPATGVVRGAADLHRFEFSERGLHWSIPFEIGQKTGYYFDQRELRGRVEALARSTGVDAKPKRVLDAYSYVGAFGLAAARAGAEVTCVDESALAMEVGAENARANGLADRMRFERGDARRAMQDAHGAYDLTIVDPPRLAPTRSAREQALVMYSKLAEIGCRATKPGGLLVLCSCSAAVDLSALTRALATGAVRANVSALVVDRAFQGGDHPVPAAFGEGLYLKALVARIEPR